MLRWYWSSIGVGGGTNRYDRSHGYLRVCLIHFIQPVWNFFKGLTRAYTRKQMGSHCNNSLITGHVSTQESMMCDFELMRFGYTVSGKANQVQSWMLFIKQDRSARSEARADEELVCVLCDGGRQTGTSSAFSSTHTWYIDCVHTHLSVHTARVYMLV